jgi:hypothetical protein
MTQRETDRQRDYYGDSEKGSKGKAAGKGKREEKKLKMNKVEAT